MILLTRRATFSAAHYYWNPDWSPEKNQAVFGPCANRNGHGHNYTLEVTVTGQIDPVSGFVVDLKWLKDLIESEIMDVYDHRHLNHEVPEFARTIPTTENLAVAIWNRLATPIAAASGASLSRIRVYETADIFAEYRGESEIAAGTAA
jgi:6-pyruvoyltetrahydropterin/6-carboxytetrahydropterin synthase